jgi:hypothetical protein
MRLEDDKTNETNLNKEKYRLAEARLNSFLVTSGEPT